VVSFLDTGLRDNGGIKPASFASMFKDNTSKKMIHISELRNDKCVSGADVSIPLASVDAKDETTMAPVWVKLHNVPIVAFSKVGLSLITTKLGRPIMLDADTITMCPNSQGRNTYARALIEVEAPPKKTPRKNGIWSGKKVDYPKRNVVFSPKTKVYYFDREDIEKVEHGNAYSKKS
nr:zinc knuckle CX2CX4HX4C [Tanacetum cinerariifolium]